MKYLIPLISAFAIIIVVAIALTSLTGQIPHSAANDPQSVSFTALSHATSDQCAYLGDQTVIYNYVYSQPNDTYFQGSCCTAMVYSHYQQQIAGLKNYSNITEIPPNPYNISVASVKQLFGYYNNITLNASQSAIFNKAASLTNDGSWCCCQCWAWYAHAGLAKYLIKYHNFNVSQIVQVTNLEDCCGG